MSFVKKVFFSLSFLVLVGMGSNMLNTEASEKTFIRENPWDNDFKNVTDVAPISSEENNFEVFWGEKAEADFKRLERESIMDKKLYDAQLMEGKVDEYFTLMKTPFAAAATTKSQYRDQFGALAIYMGIVDLPLAGNYLYHSLQDNPSPKLSPAGSGTSNALSNTVYYTQVSIPIAANIDAAAKNGKTSVSSTGSHATSTANSGLDFYLTVGKMSYDWAASKQSNGTWKVVIRFHDTYNFEHINNKRTSFPYNYVDTINNYAAQGQATGAIAPYGVHITMEQVGYKPK